MPDAVVVPVGAGSLLLGLYLGARELQRAGQIRDLPLLFAAQPANCAPLAASFAAGGDGPVRVRVRADLGRGRGDQGAAASAPDAAGFARNRTGRLWRSARRRS